MSNLADKYLNLIPQADWLELIYVATEKADYIANIIESDTSLRVQSSQHPLELS
jgi:hypothetical protein